MNTQFDIIILGGGIVGLTLAACLKQSDLKIALVEAKAFDLQQNYKNKEKDYDLRVSAINRASEMVFRNTRIWQEIKAMRSSPYLHMKVWDQAGTGEIHFSHQAINQPNLGHIIENSVIQKALLENLQAHKNFHYFAPNKALALWHNDETISLQLDDATELKARLLVGADGARSWLRDAADFAVTQKGYGHEAIVCTIETQLAHDKIARQWFLPHGVLAFLPLQDEHYCSVVWSYDAKKIDSLLEMNDAIFKDELSKASQYKLGDIKFASKRMSFPLTMRHVKKYVKPRIAIIGDAAHTIHPLAGQGMNLGIMDAACLADVIIEAYNQQRDIGHLHTLRKYERWRRGENAAMIVAMNSFKQLFSQQTKPVIWMRSLGLKLTDKTMPLKNLFSKKALGVVGDLPQIATHEKNDE